MCTGIEAALLTTAAGIGANTYGNYRSEKAADRGATAAMNAEMARQEDFDARRQATLSEMLEQTGGRDNLEAEQANERARREASYERAADVAPETEYVSPAVADSGGARVVQTAADAAAGAAAEQFQMESAALAEIESLGDALNTLNYRRAPDLAELDNLNIAAARSNRRAPMEIQTAYQLGQRRGDTTRNIGDLLSGVGMGMLGYAGYGAAGAAAAGGSQAPRYYSTHMER